MSHWPLYFVSFHFFYGAANYKFINLIDVHRGLFSDYTIPHVHIRLIRNKAAAAMKVRAVLPAVAVLQ